MYCTFCVFFKNWPECLVNYSKTVRINMPNKVYILWTCRTQNSNIGEGEHINMMACWSSVVGSLQCFSVSLSYVADLTTPSQTTHLCFRGQLYWGASPHLCSLLENCFTCWKLFVQPPESFRNVDWSCFACGSKDVDGAVKHCTVMNVTSK